MTMRHVSIVSIFVCLLSRAYYGYICSHRSNPVPFLGNYTYINEKCDSIIAKNSLIGPRFSQGSDSGSDDSMRKIRLLRTSTGRGTQDCFIALKRANGDVRMASELLLSELNVDVRSKKGNSSTPVVDLFEGRIAIKTTENLASIVDIRCETDFVAKSKIFASLAKSFINAAHEAKIVLSRDSTLVSESESAENFISSIRNMRCLCCNRTLGESGTLVRGVLKEDIVISRLGFIKPRDSELLFSYVHGPTESGGQLSLVGPSSSILVINVKDDSSGNDIGKEFYDYEIDEVTPSDDSCCISGRACIYSRDKRLAEPSGDTEYDKVKKLCRQLSMHVLGEKPKVVTLDEYDQEAVEQFKSEVRETIKGDKPQEIIDKIVAGRLRKQFGEFILMEQAWTFGNGKDTVGDILSRFSQQNKFTVEIKSFLQCSTSDNLLTCQEPQNCEFYSVNVSL